MADMADMVGMADRVLGGGLVIGVILAGSAILVEGTAPLLAAALSGLALLGAWATTSHLVRRLFRRWTVMLHASGGLALNRATPGKGCGVAHTRLRTTMGLSVH